MRTFCFAALTLFCIGLSAPSPVSAQPLQAVEIDPSLIVEDINNDLISVGQTVGRVPFILSATGLRLFPELAGEISSLRINNSGLIAGLRRAPNGATRAFRVRVDGTGYMEADFPSSALNSTVKLTDSGLLLITTGVLLRASYFNVADFVWDGRQVIDVRLAYNLPSSAFVSDLGEDGTLGGADPLPFLRRPGGDVTRPWDVSASVLKIGAASHAAGALATGLIVRDPTGSVQQIADCNFGSVQSINRAGDIVANCQNAQRARSEPYLFSRGQAINLNDYFTRPGSHLYRAVRITDGGTVLAAAVSDTGVLTARYVLLVPEEGPPTVNATVSSGIVVLTWTASTGALEYIVEAGSAPGGSDFFSGSVGLALSVTGTVPAGRYFVRVRARTVFGVSAASAELEVVVP